ncbi:hypothetical protein OSTOST_16074 [Ostertagia ostertagi]
MSVIGEEQTTYRQSGFDDNFADVVITPSYLRRVLAPQTCAINKQELVHLVKNDHVQKLHEAVEAADNSERAGIEDKRPSKEQTKEKLE